MKMNLHIHLDPIGGIAGDMFAAALLDVWPELAVDVSDALARCGLAPSVMTNHLIHADGVLTGSRFQVLPTGIDHRDAHDRAVVAGASGDDHTHWHQIRLMLETSELELSVRTHAIGIFTALAEAEARVHGTETDAVVFHEVGNLDSIADIVAAATLMARIGARSWSVGALPVGGGRVETAHGALPVPAPATTLLLEGFHWFDDGVAGERVTPTGAAILHYLQPDAGIGGAVRRLHRTGHGFGARRLPGMSNVLRVTVWCEEERGTETLAPVPVVQDDRSVGPWAESEEIAVIEFEIDDQSGESLAAGLDALRTLDTVHDVVSLPAIGKKGRMMSAVRVLARVDAIDTVAEACFRQTTTLGVRISIDQRLCLRRQELSAAGSAGERALNVKIVKRPGGETAKADIDGVLAAGSSHRERELQRGRAERAVLERRGQREDSDEA